MFFFLFEKELELEIEKRDRLLKNWAKLIYKKN